MKQLRILSLVVMLGLATPAAALDLYRIGAPGPFSIERVILKSAVDRGTFKKAGIDYQHVTVKAIERVNQMLEADEIDAHVYPSSGWKSNFQKAYCSTMIVPLVRSFSAAVVATTPNWKDLVGGTVIVSSLTSISSMSLYNMAAQNGVPKHSYTIETAGPGETKARMSLMLDKEKKGSRAGLAYDPLLEYVRRTDGVHVLADVGTHPVVSVGLFVPCADKKDPKKWKLHDRVTQVLLEEMAWIASKESESVLIPWVSATLEAGNYNKLYGTTFEGRPVRAPAIDETACLAVAPKDKSRAESLAACIAAAPAKSIAERSRKLMPRGCISRADMELSVKEMLGEVPADFEPTYYDWSLIPGCKKS